jgi:hypothetical protein
MSHIKTRDEALVWLDTVLTIETALAFWLAVFNGAILMRPALAARSRPRRVAAFTLSWLCLAQAAELLLLLWASPMKEDATTVVARLLTRSLLVAATALLTALLLRARPRR